MKLSAAEWTRKAHRHDERAGKAAQQGDWQLEELELSLAAQARRAAQAATQREPMRMDNQPGRF